MKIEKYKELEKVIINDSYFRQAVIFALNYLGDVSGKKLIDVGCGAGTMSVFFALQGAEVVGIDKRRSAVEAAQKLALKWNVQDKCVFLRGFTESMPVDTESIDIVFSKSTIQYMKRDIVLNEYMRILKSTGTLILIENLPFNPFINMYRLHRKAFSRTFDEIRYIKSIRGYLTFREIKILEDYYYKVIHREYHLFNMFFIYLNQYNKNWIIKEIGKVLRRVDEFVFYHFPFMRCLAWFSAVFCQGKRY